MLSHSIIPAAHGCTCYLVSPAKDYSFLVVREVLANELASRVPHVPQYIYFETQPCIADIRVASDPIAEALKLLRDRLRCRERGHEDVRDGGKTTASGVQGQLAISRIVLPKSCSLRNSR